MTPGPSTPVTPRRKSKPRRRTQTERSAETREKVIQAVIDCIAEEGLNNASVARIAERTGVTWGAIAHQFGDKESLLLAVIERNIETIERDFARALLAHSLSPRERVSLLIDRAWHHINQPTSVAYTELVLYGRAHPQGSIRRRQAEMALTATHRIWQRIFGDLDLDVRKLNTARTLASTAMLGMSIQGLLAPVRPSYREELEALKRIVAELLGLPPA